MTKREVGDSKKETFKYRDNARDCSRMEQREERGKKEERRQRERRREGQGLREEGEERRKVTGKG